MTQIAQSLEEKALRVRKQIIEMATQGGCFLGAAFSCVEILVFLYDSFLRIDNRNLKSLTRDYLIMSKGHAVPALYGTLIETGLQEDCTGIRIGAFPGLSFIVDLWDTAFPWRSVWLWIVSYVVIKAGLLYWLVMGN